MAMPLEQSKRGVSEQPDERISFVRRLLAIPANAVALVRRRPLLLIVLLCGSAVCAISFASAAYYLQSHFLPSRALLNVQAAFAHLDAGRNEEARDAAVGMLQMAEGDYWRQGGPLFIHGVILAREAQAMSTGAERRKLYLTAARYLEEARDRGFPPGREQAGFYCLADCLFQSGSYAESLPVLHAALERLPRQKYALYGMLARAYMNDSRPQWDKALHYNRLSLEDPSLTDDRFDLAMLQQSRILLATNQAEKCRRVLERISPRSRVYGQSLLVLGQLLIQEGDRLRVDADVAAAEASAAASERYREAIGVLERSQSADATDVAARQSRYLVGECYRKLGDTRAAEAAFARTRRIHYRTPEALVAALNEAELLLQRGQNKESLDVFGDLLANVEANSVYENAWLPLSELQDRLLAAQRDLRDTGHFELAARLNDAARTALSEADSLEAKAQIHAAWGDELQRQAGSLRPTEGLAALSEARRHYRLSADAYRQLANVRFATRHYPEDLWKSGDYFVRGQNYDMAIPLLTEYLAIAPRDERPPGLIALGETHLALGNAEKALEVLNQCVALHAKHPRSYDARLLASQACQELGKVAEAKALLVDNLHNTALTPRSVPWRESLFAYGRLLYQEAMSHEATSRKNGVDSQDQATRRQGLQDLEVAYRLFQETIRQLDEALQRYPEAPESVLARYLLAESHRQSAKFPRKTLPVEQTRARRATLLQEMRKQLQAAAESHRQLRDMLNAKQEHHELSSVESAVLRNAHFACADALFDLNEYDQAIQEYSAAIDRYQTEPESLEALLQIANCYRRLNVPSEARGTLLQAQAALTRMREDADFKKASRYDRDEWAQLIGWLCQT